MRGARSHAGRDGQRPRRGGDRCSEPGLVFEQARAFGGERNRSAGESQDDRGRHEEPGERPPKNPAERNSSSGDVSGDATMKATIGAHGTVVASMDSTTAVVPQEQKGVATAAATDPLTAAPVRLRNSAASRSVPTYTFSAAALMIPRTKYGHVCTTVIATSSATVLMNSMATTSGLPTARDAPPA